jgi:Holliday junction DNA helicase RuvB
MPESAAPNLPPPNPPTLNHVIGQKQVVDRLKVALDASFADNQPFPHTLFLGPPGLGKTSLAQLVAREMASEFLDGLGQALATPSILGGFLLRPAVDRAVLLIDEIHSLPPPCQLLLLRAMEENAVFVQNPYTQNIAKMQTVRFTLCGATTDPQLLLPPLRDRFRLVCQLEPYSNDEIADILRQRVRQLGWQVNEACFLAIASRSFGTPRLAIRLLESAQRTARSEGATFLDYGHLLRTLALEQIDALGLDSDSQRYLLHLAEASAPMRVGVLASKMRTTHLVLSQVVEEKLLFLNLIDRTPQGRVLTAKGREHAQTLKEAMTRA